MDIQNKARFVAAPLLAVTWLMFGPPVAKAELFQPAELYPIGSPPQVMAIGDVNNDGRQDVVTYVSPGAPRLMVLLQGSDGRLQLSGDYAANGYPVQSIQIADTNSDGLMDVVLGHPEYSIEIFRQNASGTLDSPVAISTYYAHDVRAADINDDGRTDIVALRKFDSYFAVFIQDSTGAMAAPVYYFVHGLYQGTGGEWPHLALSDVTGDGRNDVVILMDGTGFRVYPQLADGTLQATVPYRTGTSGVLYAFDAHGKGYGLALGDLNGDGRKDVAVSVGLTAETSRVLVFHQNTAGTLDTPAAYPSSNYPYALKTADFDKDGRDDVLVGHGLTYSMGVYLQQADGVLAAEELYPIFTALHRADAFAVGDVNGDGQTDVVTAKDVEATVVVFPGSTTNSSPIAIAGADQVVGQQALVTLDATASSDADGSIVSHVWRQVAGTPVTLQPTQSAATVTFETPKLQPGSKAESLTFEVRVTDDFGALATDQVTVTVQKKL